MSELQILNSLANLSYSEIAKWITEGVENGEQDPLRLFIAVKKFEKVLETLKADKDFMAALEREIAKYGKNPSILGFVIGQSNRTDYSYKVCKDPYLDELEIRVKERKVYLKGLIEPTADELSGGFFVNPAKPTSKNIFSFENQ